MFDDLIEQLDDALRDLERMRDGARQKGWPLEDIHLRMSYLKQSIKLTKAARDAFDRSMAGGPEGTNDEEDAP